jgi:beta-lactamase regulating signal transducer with metallopeptidase domain
MIWLLTWIGQGTAVALVVAGAFRYAHPVRGSIRHALAWLALAVVLLLPWIELRAPVSPESAEALLAPPPATVTSGELPLPAPPEWMEPTLVIFWWIWLAVGIARVVAGFKAMRDLRRAAAPCSPRLEAQLHNWLQARASGRRARLSVVPGVAMPAVAGLRQPTIVLPPGLIERLSPEDLDRIVLHELAHVRRFDDWTRLMQMGIQAVCGWHPGVWCLSRLIDLEREVACDEWVVARVRNARSYAACLVALAGSRPWSSGSVLGPALWGARRTLTPRVERLLTRWPGGSLRTSGVRIIGSTLLLTVSVLLVREFSFVIRPARREQPAAVQTAAPPPAPEGPPFGPDLAQPGPTSRRQVAVRSVPFRRTRAPLTRPSLAATVLDEPPRPSPTTLGHELLVEPAAAPDFAVLLGASRPRAPDVLESPPPPLIEDGVKPPAKRPWDAAATAGTAVASGATTAAVRTAGFFSRVGRSVARAF